MEDDDIDEQQTGDFSDGCGEAPGNNDNDEEQ